uniref:Uncharacterized protein n=1 Tax=Timema poppense TaxID=170557 RepID=A0A7R9H3J3_TIMPO|nr:unnamed protein product [Timema poppensis]
MAVIHLTALVLAHCINKDTKLGSNPDLPIGSLVSCEISSLDHADTEPASNVCHTIIHPKTRGGATMRVEHTITCSKSPDACGRTVVGVGRVWSIERRQCRDVFWSYSLLPRRVQLGPGWNVGHRGPGDVAGPRDSQEPPFKMVFRQN